MSKQKMRTYRSDLLPLKMVLTDARKDLPPRVSKKDVNEELALRLIQRMKTKVWKYLSLKN